MTLLPPPLEQPLAQKVLDYLRLEATPPSLAALDALLDAYVRRVPWESVSRITRRAQIPDLLRSARWPQLFWQQALIHGTGGTCYESNYAFFSLLRTLGYDGHLTINNMEDLVGCHAAIIIHLDDQPYLVDVGLPVHTVLPLDPATPTIRESAYHTYRATPQSNGCYLIERDRHPNPNCYTLYDTPVSNADYRAITIQDYSEENGQFLRRVIVVRVIEGVIWRFSSADGPPYHLESFAGDDKTYYHLGSDPLAAADQVAARFQLNQTLLRTAILSLSYNPNLDT